MSASTETAPAVADIVVAAEQPPESDVQAIARLAALPPMEYDRIRKDEAEKLGVRQPILDQEVSKLRDCKDAEATDPFADVEPWSEPVEGAELLTEIAATVLRFIVCDNDTAVATALWAAMTWLIDDIAVAPLALITAPEKRCGKSQLLFLLGKLCHRPITASNISASATFRAIDAWAPTLLIDEYDTFIRDNDDMRGIVNSGHTRDSAYIIRCVGDDHMPTRFSTWSAKALAGIGSLDGTILDRAVTLNLRRKLPGEAVQKLRHAEPGLFGDLSAKLARFALDQANAIRSSRPALPETLHDRAQDNWEPLLAIADAAGGDWPAWARAAAVRLSAGDDDGRSVGVRLLTDIRQIWSNHGRDKIHSDTLVNRLCNDAELGWSRYNRGRPLSQAQLAQQLAPYGIKSKSVRSAGEVKRGYERHQFDEAFERYLDPVTPVESDTPLQPRKYGAPSVADQKNGGATNFGAVLQRYTGIALQTECSGTQNQGATPKPLQDGTCSTVALQTGVSESKKGGLYSESGNSVRPIDDGREEWAV